MIRRLFVNQLISALKVTLFVGVLYPNRRTVLINHCSQSMFNKTISSQCMLVVAFTTVFDKVDDVGGVVESSGFVPRSLLFNSVISTRKFRVVSAVFVTSDLMSRIWGEILFMFMISSLRMTFGLRTYLS